MGWGVEWCMFKVKLVFYFWLLIVCCYWVLVEGFIILEYNLEKYYILIEVWCIFDCVLLGGVVF